MCVQWKPLEIFFALDSLIILATSSFFAALSTLLIQIPFCLRTIFAIHNLSRLNDLNGVQKESDVLRYIARRSEDL